MKAEAKCQLWNEGSELVALPSHLHAVEKVSSRGERDRNTDTHISAISASLFKRRSARQIERSYDLPDVPNLSLRNAWKLL